MRALQKLNTHLQHSVWRRSVGACLAVDAFRQSRDPELLQEIQEELARGLLWVEARLRSLDARRPKRAARVAGLLQKDAELGPRLGAHQKELSVQVASLKHERNVLRQIGDAVAWSVLRDDPSLIGPLWADGRSHHLPEGIGLEAPIQVTRELNASGEFFAVYNDLTRCLGVGDVTVVSTDGAWRVPLSMELKARWADEARGVAEIDFLSPHSDRPDFKALFDSVSARLGLRDRRNGSLDPRAQRQVDELLERTDLIHRMQARLATRLEPPGNNHWKAVQAVLHRAYTTGFAYDVPEQRVAFFAVRVHENESAAQQLQRAIDRLEADFPLGHKGEAVSSSDLASHARISVLVPPVLLWPISGELRNALLAGRLFFGVRMAQDLWSRAFEAEDLSFKDSETEWRVSRDGEVGRLDRLEVWKLQLGVALSGVSAASVAASLREALAEKEAT